MDMPLPVIGGIMVIASPTQISARAAAGCGCNESPATAQKELLSSSALASRWRNGETTTDARADANGVNTPYHETIARFILGIYVN
jgi:hypothetical protein